MAKYEASVSTAKGASSSIARTTDSAISFLRFSNVVWASLDMGKVDVAVRGRIFSE